MITIFATFKNHEEARKVATTLLEKRLIACANFFPIESMYRWKGEIEKDLEIGAFLKSKEDYFEEIKSEIEKIHSYEVPCIEKLSSTASRRYEEWIDIETR